MPDWQELVEQRLGRLKLSPVCEREVIAELADHLAERREAALRQGSNDPEAVAMALEEVPDWVALNGEISATRREEESMSEHTKTIVVPGMTMLIGSAVLLLLAVRLLPPTIWVSPRAPVLVPAFWLLLYCGMGALGAQWSRRAGGSTPARFLTGVFPAFLHLAIFVCVGVATIVAPPPGPPDVWSLKFVLIRFASFVIMPGVALAVGTLPFLRGGKRDSTALPAIQ